jgi:hypothetical protein
VVPLSILLADTLSVIVKGVTGVAAWQSITETWTLVVHRLRSAWLVGWFGSRLPISGIDLHVVFVNHEQLRRRWALVTRSDRSTADRPSLLEPLLGISGSLVGTLTMPLNGMLALAALARLKQGIGLTVVAVTNALLYGLPLSAILLLAVPLAAVLLFANLAGPQHLEELELLAAATALVLPLTRIWRQASGAEPVRNPLFAQLLGLLERIVELLPHLLAVVAVAVTRIAPLLAPMRDAILATYLAVTEILAAIKAVADNTWTALSMLWSGPNYLAAALGALTRSVHRLLTRIGVLVRGTLHELTGILLRNLSSTVLTVARWLISVARFVKTVVIDHPVVRALIGLLGAIDVVKAWWARRPPKPTSTAPAKPPSPWLTSFPWPASARALVFALKHTPPTPKLTVPDFPPLVGAENIGPIAEAMRTGGFGAPADPFALDAAQRARLERYRRPPAALGALWREVDEAAKQQKARDRIFSLSESIGRLSELIGPAAEGAVGAQAAAVLPDLDRLLDQLDVAARGRRIDHPVRDLPEPSQVRPVIGRLRVRAQVPDGAGDRVRAEIEAFTTLLRQRLDAAPYPVGTGAAP